MTTVDVVVQEYLDRLSRAAASLPPDRRSELLEGIGEHIASARAAGAAGDEAAARTLLDRLGEPEEIVEAAHEEVSPGFSRADPYAGPSTAAPAPVYPPRGTGLELAAVLLLTAGSLVPLIGWVAGVVLLWLSPLWRAREKLLGTLVVPFGPGGLLLWGAVAPGATCTSSSQTLTNGTVILERESCSGVVLPLPLTVVAVAVVLVAPIVVAVFLMRIARRRAADAPPAVGAGAPPAESPWGGLELSAVLLLGLGGLLVPVVGALVGLVLACVSPRWRAREKVLAGAIALSLPGLVLASIVLPYPLKPFQAAVGGWELFLLLLISCPLAATYLAVVLQRRRDAYGPPRVETGRT